MAVTRRYSPIQYLIVVPDPDASIEFVESGPGMNAHPSAFEPVTSAPPMRWSRAPALAGALEPSTMRERSVAKSALTSYNRRMRRAAKLFDRHGTALHTIASVLTTDPLHAETLVIDAISSQIAPPLTDQNTKQRSVRELAAAVYVAWSCRPAPPDPVGPTGIKPPSTTLTALRRLPEDHRAVLALCTFGGHTYRQAAAVLGLPDTKIAELLCEALLTVERPHGGQVPS